MTDKLGPYELNTIITGDARELAQAIPDESFDMVFTDPPYLEEYLPLYGWLARESARVLKPGGFLFAYTAGYHLPRVFAQMEGQGLDYFYQMALVHAQNQPRIWSRNMMSSYKPIMIYSKGTPNNPPWLQTLIRDKHPDKRYHIWEQGIHFPLWLFQKFNGRISTIWEPFAGGGTTCVAALLSGLEYLAFEIDPMQAHIARQRVSQMQMPLFILDPTTEQLEMEL